MLSSMCEERETKVKDKVIFFFKLKKKQQQQQMGT